MKKLTVLLATLLVFFSADAQQILSGIYSGSMYNDTTKMLTKYELALSEYRGKVFGYSYNTFIVNDTFYYGIRRVKGYKNDKGELVLTDEELLANNFPESPAKRIKRTAVFPLAQEDTITSLTGSWQTNRTRQYYSVGGATKTERSVDSSQSPLVAHLKELDIISSGPNYQDDPVVKGKKKDEKKPKEVKKEEAKETGVARRNDKKAEAAKPREDKPAVNTTPDASTAAANKPARDNAAQKDDNTVAVASRKEPATAGGQKDTDPNTTAAAKPAVSTNAPAGNGTQPADDKKPAATGTVAANTSSSTTGIPAKDVQTAVDKKPGNNAIANNPAAATASAPQKEVPAAARPAATTGNPVAAAVNNDEIDPTTGDLIIKKPAGTPSNNKPVPAASNPVSNNDVAKATDKKAAEREGTKPANDAIAGIRQAEADKVSGQKSEAASNGPTTSNITTKQPSEKPVTVAPVAVAALDTRTSAVIKTLEIVNDSVTLSFYDNGVVDGDIISVFVNGENVVASQKLNEVAIKKTVHLTNFAADSVEVTLVAETLGSIPPNTGLVLVHDGDKRYDVRFSADMKTNASIIFRKVKK